MPLVKIDNQLYEEYAIRQIDGVVNAEISNTSGTPIPISDAGGSITVDGPLTDAQLRASGVVVTDGSSSLTVDGRAFRSTVSITRPNNATAYSAGDVIGIADAGTPANAGSAVHTLTSVGPSGGYILVQSASLFVDSAVVPAGMAAFRVHMYRSQPTAILDNAAFNLVSGDRSGYMGYIDLPTPVDLGDTIYTQTDYPGRLVKLDNANMFVEIETRGAFTPSSGAVVEFRMSTLEAGL